jgi:hypothetical protein
MATTFKHLPRFADSKVKKENLIDFVSSLEVSKKFDKKAKKERIVNIEEYFLFNNLYNSCSEIIRNENVLADRNTKANVHTLITTSSLSNDLAFIAENIDGVTDSMRSKIATFGNESNFELLTQAAKSWEETSKQVSSLVEQLRTIVETNLEQGYGSPRQLRAYQSKKLNNKREDVKKAYFEDKKTTKEIAEQIGVRHGLVQLLVDELIDEHLHEKTDEIKKRLEENISRSDIATEFRTSRKKLAKFIADNGLLDTDKAKAEKTQAAKKTTASKTAETKKATAAKTTAAKKNN